MEKRKEAALLEIAPIFLEKMYGDKMETCMHWGCECGEGWFQILKDFCQKIEEENKQLNGTGKIVANQIKEKWGVLTIYLSFDGEISDDLKEKVEHLLEEAEEASWNTCERCGKPATQTTKGWIHRLCDTCFNLRRSGIE